MVTRYGMEEKLGQLSYQDEPAPFLAGIPMQPGRRHSEETEREIDRAVRAISERAFATAVNILSTNRTTLEQGARELLQKETLVETEIAAIATTLKRAA
jgi:cell division protease FtsH